MRHVGKFESTDWGLVHVYAANYAGPNGPLAIILETSDSEPLATLSVNMYKPDCSQDSQDLPANCFYMKSWSENETLSMDAVASGLFKRRADIPAAESGYVIADAFELLA